MPKARSILFVGHAPIGVWTIRGAELAESYTGWSASLAPSLDDIRSADLVVIVKFARTEVIETARQYGKPVLWDCNDAFETFLTHPQTAAQFRNLVASKDLNAIVRFCLAIVPSDGIICANPIMRQDFVQFHNNIYDIPHHYRQGLKVKAEAPAVFSQLAYDGDVKYLDDDFYGMFDYVRRYVGISKLHIGYGEQLADIADACLGYRKPDPALWLRQRWKPGVKIVNTLAAGLPFITHPEASYLDTRAETGMLIYWDRDSLIDALLTCRRKSYRAEVIRAAVAFRKRYSLQAIRDRYDSVFTDMLGTGS